MFRFDMHTSTDQSRHRYEWPPFYKISTIRYREKEATLNDIEVTLIRGLIDTQPAERGQSHGPATKAGKSARCSDRVRHFAASLSQTPERPKRWTDLSIEKESNGSIFRRQNNQPLAHDDAKKVVGFFFCWRYKVKFPQLSNAKVKQEKLFSWG